MAGLSRVFLGVHNKEFITTEEVIRVAKTKLVTPKKKQVFSSREELVDFMAQQAGSLRVKAPTLTPKNSATVFETHQLKRG